MSATATQRLVPIRPSPHKGLTTVCSDTPSTLTPPKTGVKRKLNDPSPDPVKCKRRINFSVGYVMAQKPAAVARRNARERNRVKQVNNGFATLRQHIPGAAKAKKISKVETLKQAVEYIRSLQLMLDEHDELMSLTASANTNTNTDNLGTNHVITTTLPFTTGSSSTTTTALSQQTMYRTFQQLQTQYLYSSENLSPVTQSMLGSLGAQVSLRPLPSSSLSPTCSDASSVSPVPSYLSEKSFPATELPTSAASFPHVSEISAFDAFDAYDTVASATTNVGSATTSPEDEELLDVIAFWQEA